jgi:urea transport system substrate-binding protein
LAEFFGSMMGDLQSKFLSLIPHYLVGLIAIVGLTLVIARIGKGEDAVEPLRIGVLHSQSGTMAISETPLVSAAQLAVDEINGSGGVRGRPLEALIVDIRSDWDVAAREAERLLTQQRVVSLFGCWTSACRKAVLPILQRHRGLLWYPVQYEGRENSPFVIYTGAAPNQQILPAFDWALKKFGSRIFLIGSDYIFPRTANLIIRQRASAKGATIVGEHYLPLGSSDVKSIVGSIIAARPDFVINTINGDTNVNFFFELSQASSRRRIPTLSFSIAENEIRTIGTRLLQGNYVAWNYFQSLESAENRAFVAAYRQQFGQNAVTSDPIEAAYFQVRAFAEAASNARTLTPMAIRDAALGLAMVTPGGYIRIDPKSNHTWKTVRLGEIMPDGQIRTLQDSVFPVEPNPFANGQDPAPALLEQQTQIAPMSVDFFISTLSDPSRTATGILTLRRLALLPWSTEDRARGLNAAARSANLLIRYEAARAIEQSKLPRRDLISALLDSDDSFDHVNALRLLSLEGSVHNEIAARAVRLLAHEARRVRLAAGVALIAQGSLGWRADAEGTSRIIAGFEDEDLGVQRNAFALASFSKQFTSRILPILAELDLKKKSDFFRAPLCKVMAQLVLDTAAQGDKATGAKTVSELDRIVVQLERANCLPANEVSAVRAAVDRASNIERRGLIDGLEKLFQTNFGVAIVVVLILLVVALEILALFVTALVLLFRPALVIDLLGLLSRLDGVRFGVWKFEINLFDALSPTWLRNSRRALAAWVRANLNDYRDSFARSATVQLRQKHVLLPTMFPDKMDPVEPSPDEIRRLIHGDRLKLHIVGEGGTGKTSLACLVARWSMSDHGKEQIQTGNGRRQAHGYRIAVIFEPGEHLLTTPVGFSEGLQRKLMIDSRFIPLWLVKGLMNHGLLLAIVDDLFEIEGVTPEVLSSHELRALWLITTSRLELPAGMGDWSVVRPQKLRGRILTEFFVNYAKISGHADKMGDDDIEVYVTQFKQLLGADESRQETVVYFARLFFDYVMDLRSKDGTTTDGAAGRRRPRSLPELIENFVERTCRHAATRHKIPPAVVQALVRRAAYIAISARQRPGPLSLEKLAKQSDDIKKRLGTPSTVNLEQVLIDTGLLERATAYLRFNIDVVHEYCAVFYVRDGTVALTRGEAYERWKKWVDDIRAAADVQPKSSGLLKAIYECLRSDRVASDVPEDLLALIAELLGVQPRELQPIRIGILHSLQGTMAMSEIALRDAALLAVQEINQSGGIAGRRLEAIVCDGASDPEVFAREARRLVRDDGVASIFGCWTSATRKAVKPIVEAEHSLLWYPVQYEGYEQSKAIIYTGAAPNQQIIPAVEWCLDKLLVKLDITRCDARFYLVGSDYVFPRRANAIIRRYLREKNIDPVGERYAPLGETNFNEIVDDLERTQPHIIINTVNGSSNISFFRGLWDRGIKAEGTPVVSLSVAEAEIRDIGIERLRGHYAVWNYFQSLPGAENDQFVSAFQQHYGTGRVTSDPIATSYIQIKLFSEAAQKARVLSRDELRQQLARVEINTPAGRLRFDPPTGHFSKHVYVGRINEEGQFDIVESWNNGDLVAPNPFPFQDLSEDFLKNELQPAAVNS